MFGCGDHLPSGVAGSLRRPHPNSGKPPRHPVGQGIIGDAIRGCQIFDDPVVRPHTRGALTVPPRRAGRVGRHLIGEAMATAPRTPVAACCRWGGGGLPGPPRPVQPQGRRDRFDVFGFHRVSISLRTEAGDLFHAGDGTPAEAFPDCSPSAFPPVLTQALRHRSGGLPHIHPPIPPGQPVHRPPAPTGCHQRPPVRPSRRSAPKMGEPCPPVGVAPPRGRSAEGAAPCGRPSVGDYATAPHPLR